AEYLGTGARKVRLGIAKGAGLRCTARRVVLRVEIEDHLFASERLQRHSAAAVGRQRKFGRHVAHLDRHIIPSFACAGHLTGTQRARQNQAGGGSAPAGSSIMRRKIAWQATAVSSISDFSASKLSRPQTVATKA